MANFIVSLYKSYVDLYFTYLEVNPLVITKDSIFILDLAAKVSRFAESVSRDIQIHFLHLKQLDATADFICRGKWGKVDYPPPFGRDAFPEEAYIADIDAKTGASLKVKMSVAVPLQ